jgi:pimeloyl-ACP methyl ester carboxylesterase
MTKKRGRDSPPGVNLRRMYVDCRFGQLHLRSAFPSNGGFDELTTLICLHQSPMSSRAFGDFLGQMATDRSVYAPDLPGYGESDAPLVPPSIADYAAAIGDFVDQMRFRQVDLLGYHTGSSVAAELAIARPEQVRRVVMVAAPVFTAGELDAFEKRPWPVPVREDGAHLAEEWQRTLRSRGPGVPLERLAEGFADKLGGGARAGWGTIAAMRYPAQQRLQGLAQPTLVLRPKDDLWDVTPRAKPLLPDARFVDLADLGFGLFDAAPEIVARHVRAFLD